jgi:hypothetical protein
MMNALSVLVALAAIVFFWWPFGTFVFERLTQGRQPPTPWTARPIEGRGTRAEGLGLLVRAGPSPASG